eukprot:Amastigsp_a679145_59.p2 type:complete len:202 gc:universal Amastigsp_a679145_59:671-66(-)
MEDVVLDALAVIRRVPPLRRDGCGVKDRLGLGDLAVRNMESVWLGAPNVALGFASCKPLLAALGRWLLVEIQRVVVVVVVARGRTSRSERGDVRRRRLPITAQLAVVKLEEVFVEPQAHLFWKKLQRQMKRVRVAGHWWQATHESPHDAELDAQRDCVLRIPHIRVFSQYKRHGLSLVVRRAHGRRVHKQRAGLRRFDRHE